MNLTKYCGRSVLESFNYSKRTDEGQPSTSVMASNIHKRLKRNRKTYRVFKGETCDED